MKNKYTNKNGVKILVAVMALAIVFAGFIITDNGGTDGETSFSPNDYTIVDEATQLQSNQKYYVPEGKMYSFSIKDTEGSVGGVEFYVGPGAGIALGPNIGSKVYWAYENSGGIKSDETAVMIVPSIGMSDVLNLVAGKNNEGSKNTFTVSGAATTLTITGKVSVSGELVLSGDVPEGLNYAVLAEDSAKKTLYSEDAIEESYVLGVTGGITSVTVGAGISKGVSVLFTHKNGVKEETDEVLVKTSSSGKVKIGVGSHLEVSEGGTEDVVKVLGGIIEKGSSAGVSVLGVYQNGLYYASINDVIVKETDKTAKIDSDVTIFGEQTIKVTGNITLNANIKLATDVGGIQSKLTIPEGATIKYTSGKGITGESKAGYLVNNGKMNITTSMSIHKFENNGTVVVKDNAELTVNEELVNNGMLEIGVAGDSTTTPTVTGSWGILIITNTKITNTSGAVLTIANSKSIGTDQDVVNGGTIEILSGEVIFSGDGNSNSGTISVAKNVSFQVGTLINQGKIENLGTFKITGKVENKNDDGKSILNGGKIELGAGVLLGKVTNFVPEGAAVIGTITATGAPAETATGVTKGMDTYYAVMKKTTDEYLYYVYGDGYEYDLGVSGCEYGLVTAGTLVNDEETFTVFTDSRFIMTACGDYVSYSDSETTVSSATVEKVGSDDGEIILGASLEVEMIGGKITVTSGGAVEFRSMDIGVKDDDKVSLNGASAVIPADVTIDFRSQAPIQKGTLYVYGDITSTGVANPKNCISNETKIVLPGASAEKVAAISAFTNQTLESAEVSVADSDEAMAALELVDEVTLTAATIGADITIPEGKVLNLKGTTYVSASTGAVGISGGKIVGNLILAPTASLEDVEVDGEVSIGTEAEGETPKYNKEFTITPEGETGKLIISLGIENGEVTLTGTVVDATIDAKGQTVSVGAGSVFTDVEIKVGTSSVTFEGISTTEGLTISERSVALSGDVVLTGDILEGDALTIVGPCEISSATPVRISVTAMEVKGEVTLSENVTILVDSGKTLTVDTGAKIKGDGKVKVDNGTLVNKGTIEATIEADGYTFTVYDGAQLQANIDDFTSFILGGDIGLSGEFEISAGKVIDLAGHTMTIDAEVKVTKSNILNGTIAVNAGKVLTLNEAEVWCAVQAADEDGIIIEKATTTTISNDSLRSISVGYGNTIVLDNYTVRNGHSVEVYGNLVVKTNATVLAGGSIVLRGTSYASIDGTMKVEGTFEAEDLSSMTVNGNIIVGNDAGTAKIEGSVMISQDGALTIAKSKSTTEQNKLMGSVLDYGTLTVNGQITASVWVYGTLNFNGTAVGTNNVYIMDGVTVNFASVTGTLNVSDLGSAVDAYDEYGVLEGKTVVVYGNNVTLSNVKGVTVSVSVTEKIQKLGTENHKVYTSSMTVTGTISDVDTKDTLSASLTAAYVKGVTGISDYEKKITAGKLNVKDVSLGEKVSVTLAGATIGDITAVSKESKLVITSGTINGLVTIGPEADSGSRVGTSVNTTAYTVTATDGKVTEYYTNLADAIASASTADEKTVTVYGSSNKVKTAMEIGSGIKVVLYDGTKITISAEGSITVAADALLDASKGKVTVDGVLTINDKDEAFVAPSVTKDFVYQVSKTTGSVIVYSGLAGALKNAVSGDVITLQQDAVLSEDTEIKEGVTLVVPKGKTLFVGNKDKEITLTINGKLEVQKDGFVKLSEDEGTVDAMGVEMVINGVVTDSTSNEDNFLGFDATDFVWFQLDKKTNCLSNINYAAQNASFGDVVIIGTHSAGDVTFKKGADAEYLTVILFKEANPDEKEYGLSVNSITLDGAALCVYGAVSFNGTIVGDSDAGVASISFEGAKNFAVVQYMESKVTGDIEHLTIAAVLDGKATVVAGTITVGSGFAIGDYIFDLDEVSVSGSKTNTLVIAEGATLIVPKGMALETSCGTGDVVLFVEGTLLVDEGTADIENAAISGTLNIEGKNVTVSNTFVIGNIVAMAEDKENDVAAGLLKIGMGVSLGDAPSTIGANGTIAGDVEFVASSDYLVVYAGGNVSAAKIEWNNATDKTNAKVTEFYINGMQYMTVYAKGTTTPLSIANGLGIELVGYDTPKTGAAVDIVWYADEDLTQKITSGSVGEYSKVYTVFEISGVPGKISVGTGIGLYIDGLKFNSDGASAGGNVLKIGKHTITYDVQAGYDKDDVKVTFNGAVVANGGSIEITADMTSFTLIASGAVPTEPTPVTPGTQPAGSDDEMGITEYLLIVLVVLAAILVVVVAIRMMRN